MKVPDYIKERRITLGFLLAAFLFALVIYRLDDNFSIRESNAAYIFMGWGILFAAYLMIDYHTLNSRIEKLRNYCRFNGSSDDADAIAYPSDRMNAELVRALASEYEKYKAEIGTKSAEEMEYITKWLHDVKVPIAAAKLILESNEEKLPGPFYHNIQSELFSIEESIQQVFFEMKSNRFFDDYKIAETSTQKLIAQALKGYSSFFSYKKLGIAVTGADTKVLTDEKWSGYILSQIISNAVKYTPEGGAIEVITEQTDETTTISVKNQGKGISARDLDRIFQKGFTASGGSEGAKATGYGLYLSKKLSDLLGHSLTAESIENEYAVFRMTFYDHDTLFRSGLHRNVTKM